MLHAQLIGYGWAFSAAIGNGIQDNLRKYATKSIKNPLHVVAMMEMLNCVTLFLFVFCTGQGELIFGKRKPLFRQKHEPSRSYGYENDDDQIARTHLIVLASISALIKCVGSVALSESVTVDADKFVRAVHGVYAFVVARAVVLYRARNSERERSVWGGCDDGRRVRVEQCRCREWRRGGGGGRRFDDARLGADVNGVRGRNRREEISSRGRCEESE